ncbi:MAG: HepT-like ribonuclease domain-containing protein [Ignavibacteria bacterium]
MKRVNKDCLYELKDSIEKIINYTSYINFEDFANSSLIQDAVIRRFDIISQTCYDLSQDLKDKIDFIPWDRIIDIKKRLVNDDLEVNTAKVWEIIKEDLPIFKDDINKVIKAIG